MLSFWSNLVPQLLDFVIKHELEFIQLLNLLSQFFNLLIFVLDSELSLMELIFQTLNDIPLPVGVVDLFLKLIVLFLDLLVKL